MKHLCLWHCSSGLAFKLFINSKNQWLWKCSLILEQRSLLLEELWPLNAERRNIPDSHYEWSFWCKLYFANCPWQWRGVYVYGNCCSLLIYFYIMWGFFTEGLWLMLALNNKGFKLICKCLGHQYTNKWRSGVTVQSLMDDSTKPTLLGTRSVSRNKKHLIDNGCLKYMLPLTDRLPTVLGTVAGLGRGTHLSSSLVFLPF